MSQHVSVFQDAGHILLLTTGFPGRNTKLRMSTLFDVSDWASTTHF